MNQNKPPLYPDVKIKSQNVILATAESPIIYEIEFVEDYKELENIIHGK
jgi:CTP:phosphocholine cytidylyltransferase-like protein